MRNLTAHEIAQLQSQGNIATDWSRIFVADPVSLISIRNNYFEGEIRIGILDGTILADHDLSLPCGIYGCMLSNVTIGNRCALHQVRNISHYNVGDHCLLFNIGELTASANLTELPRMDVMNENGGRSISPCRGMRVSDAYLWARYRDHECLMERLRELTQQSLKQSHGYGIIGPGAVIKHTQEIHNVIIDSALDARTRIYDCIALTDGVIGCGCKLEYGIVAQRFLLGENVTLEYSLRLNDTVVGDNSTLARCEIGNSLIFPAHEQHHNNSFLIAALLQGQSNVAAGGTLGSNHNGRTADNELSAGRGFWPGLCVSVKHSSRFASYTLLAKADFPSELNITLPFALVNNNVAKNQLEVMPAYWWMYNMYALHRNINKFAKRDKRHFGYQHIEFDPFAPDTAEEMMVGRGLLRLWTEKAYQEHKGNSATTLTDALDQMQKVEVLGYGMEHNKRKTVILKAGAGYRAYEEMIIYYAMRQLTERFGNELPNVSWGKETRVQRWVNLGGQLVEGPEADRLIAEIENHVINSWEEIHQRLDSLWQQYPEAKCKHAYQMLCELSQRQSLNEQDWQQYLSRFAQIQQYVTDQVRLTRQKDETNEFRKMTYWNEGEMDAVLG